MSAVVVGLIAAGCSGTDGSSVSSEPPVTAPATDPTALETTTTSTSTTSTTSTTTTTEPLPVVETVPPTDPSTSVGDTSTTEATTTTVPAPEGTLPVPTNTMFDPTTPEGAVEQAVLGDAAAYSVCMTELPRCDVASANRFAALDYAEGAAEIIEDWNDNGYATRDADQYTVELAGDPEFSEDGTEAIVPTCGSSGFTLFRPATEDVEEEIIDDDFVSFRQRLLVRRFGNSWFVTASETVELANGKANNVCI